MLLPPEVMRFLLLGCWIGMSVLAVLFLRGRRLTFWAYLGCGMAATLLPFLGPFLVILFHPGKSFTRKLRRRRRPVIRLSRLHFS